MAKKKKKKDCCPEIVENVFYRCGGGVGSSVSVDNIPRAGGVGNPAVVAILAQFVVPILTHLLDRCGKKNDATVQQQAVVAGTAPVTSAQSLRTAYTNGGRRYCYENGITFRRRDWLMDRGMSQTLATAGLHELAAQPKDQLDTISSIGEVLSLTVDLDG